MSTGTTILVLGGAKSGKSSFALETGEKIINSGNNGKGLFIATAKPSDNEMKERIKRHRLERGDEWKTIEEPLEITKTMLTYQKTFDVILIDCLTLWLTNIILQDMDPEYHTERLIKKLPEMKTATILVSNEVGMGIVPDNPLARRFREMSGMMNRKVAAACKQVYFVTAGISMCIKHKSTGG